MMLSPRPAPRMWTSNKLAALSLIVGRETFKLSFDLFANLPLPFGTDFLSRHQHGVEANRSIYLDGLEQKTVSFPDTVCRQFSGWIGATQSFPIVTVETNVCPVPFDLFNKALELFGRSHLRLGRRMPGFLVRVRIAEHRRQIGQLLV